MANLIPLAYADVELQLASALSVGDTSLTLSSATDDDGNALPAGKYCFTVDNGSTNKEYLMGQLNGVNVTSVVSVSRQGVESSGVAKAHRVGASAIISDFATIQRVADALRGQIALDGDNAVIYDAEPTLTDRKELATVAYVLDNVAGGTVSFDNQIITSSDATAGETVADEDWVFFNTADQEWYLIDADTSTEVDASYIGVALGAGTDGASITGGIQISGVFTTTGLTAGDVYYLSNTAGEITNSAGTTERAIGVALSTTKLLMNFNEKRLPTADEKDALAGAAATPSTSNKYLTEGDIDDATLFKPMEIVTFTSSGTWTKDAGLKYIVIEGVGAGASANSTNSGGGGGYFKKLLLASSLGSTETVTIGTTGSPGGNTTFGSHATGNGGTRPTGGTATGGDINIGGGDGQDSGSGGTGGNYGIGGHSMLGIAHSNSSVPSGYGAGAAGENGAGTVNGTDGIIIVTEYYV